MQTLLSESRAKLWQKTAYSGTFTNFYSNGQIVQNVDVTKPSFNLQIFNDQGIKNAENFLDNEILAGTSFVDNDSANYNLVFSFFSYWDQLWVSLSAWQLSTVIQENTFKDTLFISQSYR